MSRFQDDTQRTTQRSTNPANAAQTGTAGAGLTVGDFVLIGFCFFLVVAIIGAAFLVIGELTGKAAPNINLSIFFIILIYVLCVGAGWLWGRYQSQTMAHKENSRLKEENFGLKNAVERLESERFSLQAQLRSTQTAPGAATPARTSQGSPAGLVPVVSSKQPAPNIYESAREPEDPRDLPEHPHERVFPARNEGNSLRFGWRIIGASRRGFGHAYEGKYREDDFNVRIYGAQGQQPDIAIIAIADGVSSKNLSRRGARAAVLGATEFADQRMNNLRNLVSHQADQENIARETFTILMDALKTARFRIEESAARSRVSVDELQSTLLVYLAMPWDENSLLVSSTQIGDGALFVLQHTQQEKWKWIQQPQIQSAGNEVHPFMRSTKEEWERYFHCHLLSHARCIMGMTDGTADDIEPPRATRENPNPDQFMYVHDFYARIVLPTFTAPQPGEELLKLLAYQKKTSHDDRTVVCLYRQ